MNEREIKQLMLIAASYHPNTFKDEYSFLQTVGAYYLVLKEVPYDEALKALINVESKPTYKLPSVGEIMQEVEKQRDPYVILSQKILAFGRVTKEDHEAKEINADKSGERVVRLVRES